MEEKLLYITRDLQRFDKAVAPVFIFGSYLGVLTLTDSRLLFLSSGGTGYANVLGQLMLGVLTPEQLRTFDAALANPGSLEIPFDRVVAVGGFRRWDFGRYLRIDYLEEDGTPKQTSLIPRGVAGSGWIDTFVAEVSQRTDLASESSGA